MTAMVGILQALPGTKLYERMNSEHRLLNSSSGDNADGNTNIMTTMDSATLRKGYADMMNHLYAPKHYYQRIRTLLQEYKAPETNTRIRITQLMALARSMVLRGIIGRERFQYWKMLLWTLFKRRKALFLVVTLSIYGLHFRKVCQLHLNKEEGLTDAA